jgi:hypothetical protein
MIITYAILLSHGSIKLIGVLVWIVENSKYIVQYNLRTYYQEPVLKINSTRPVITIH